VPGFIAIIGGGEFGIGDGFSVVVIGGVCGIVSVSVIIVV
jgi:hypothetical protein